MHIIVDVEGIQEATEDGEVGWVGSCGWFVIVAEAFEESSEYWIVADGSESSFAGIASTQVGDPLAHRFKGLRDCITSNNVLGGVGLPIAESEDRR